MPKRKTHKGLTKRVTVTARGKVLHAHPGASHLMSGKRGKRRRHLRRIGKVQGAMQKRILLALS